MMLFRDWRIKGRGKQISPVLLWDCDVSKLDWNESKTFVMRRVIERGNIDDWYAAIYMYGGIRKVREIIKEVNQMYPRDMAFVCFMFNLKKEDLKCYTRKQSRLERMNSYEL